MILKSLRNKNVWRKLTLYKVHVIEFIETNMFPVFFPKKKDFVKAKPFMKFQTERNTFGCEWAS